MTISWSVTISGSCTEMQIRNALRQVQCEEICFHSVSEFRQSRRACLTEYTAKAVVFSEIVDRQIFNHLLSLIKLRSKDVITFRGSVVDFPEKVAMHSGILQFESLRLVSQGPAAPDVSRARRIVAFGCDLDLSLLRKWVGSLYLRELCLLSCNIVDLGTDSKALEVGPKLKFVDVSGSVISPAILQALKANRVETWY